MVSRIKNPRFEPNASDRPCTRHPSKRRNGSPARFYQLKTGHALTATHPEVDQAAGGRPVLVVLPIQTDLGALA